MRSFFSADAPDEGLTLELPPHAARLSVRGHINQRVPRGHVGLCVPAALVFVALTLTSCSQLPSWLTGAEPVIKRAVGDRVDVVAGATGLTADAAVADIPVEVPDQTNLEQWRNTNEAMLTGHVGLTGVTREQSVTIGDSNAFSRSVVSAPVVADGIVFAMDAAGVVSAHNEADITDVKWRNDDTINDSARDALGGGIAAADGIIYATTGMGSLRAIDAANGQVKWNVKVGAPVRGAPAIAKGIVVVLTADNQTLAYDATNGQPKWEQRGIREVAGYFSTTAPVISDDIVVSVYSSGEVFAIRLDSGSVLWRDTLAAGSRTKASAVFSGIDADPIVQEGVVVVTSASGVMQASALLNGRPLWQAKIGAHATPWSAGNVLFVLSDTNDIAAVFKRDGSVRWASSLAVHDATNPKKDKSPPLYGPILSANAVLVVDGEGTLTSFKPTSGERIDSYELTSGIVTAPVVVNGAMYVITKAGKLYKYY